MPKKINKKQTGKKVARLGGKGLENPKTPKAQREIDASVVGQAPFKKKIVNKAKHVKKSAKKGR